MNRSCVIVSPHFPPSMLAGAHRARHLAKHLSSCGWTPVVVCVNEADYAEPLDPALAALLPSDIEVAKSDAVSSPLARCIGVGDIGLRAWPHLRQTVSKIITSRFVRVVLITGSPFYPMLLAPWLKKRFRIPVVLDFQDPWVSAWGAAQPTFSKAGLSHRLGKFLEPRALRGADYVTVVSDAQSAEMASRYPWLDQSRMAAIPIGGDPDDFAGIGQISKDSGDFDLEPGFIHLSYVGTYWPKVGPTVRLLLRAFVKLRSAEPAVASRIRLNFVGTSAQPDGHTLFRIKPIAEEEGIAEFVHEIPRRIPYLKALKVLSQSNGLLLVGSDEPHYTASKIYPALMSGRPFLSLFHRESSAHAILSASGGGLALAFSTGEELAALETKLAEGLRNLALHPERFGVANLSAYAPFEARNIARRFADIFDRLASGT